MTKEDFVSLLVDEDWMWADHTEKKVVGVAFKKEFNGEYVKYHLSNEGIKQLDKDMLLEKLRSHDVYHMSRVVGYFARIGNWNKSKLGELKDRQKGVYSV